MPSRRNTEGLNPEQVERAELGLSEGGRIVDSPYTKEEEKALLSRYGKATYLAALAETGAPFLASRVTRIRQAVVREWIKDDPDFAAELEQIEGERVEAAELALYQRAVVGWEEPVGFYQGESKVNVRKFSDANLALFLKAHRPEKYRENINVQAQMPDGFIDVTKLTNEQLERLRAGENALAVLGMKALKGMVIPTEIVQEDEKP